MITIVTWLWKPQGQYHTQYGPEHVSILFRMIQRHYPHPFRFVCITDMDWTYHKFDIGIDVIGRDDPFPKQRNPFGPGTPTCYRRLELFGPFGKEIGERIVSIDLDVVITGDLTPIFDRSEDFIIWRSFARQTQYNGSLWMLNTGARPRVWEKFIENPERAIERARGAGFYGSDQAWMNYILGPKERCYGEHDGVYSYRRHLRHGEGLPETARIVFFEGLWSPWREDIQQRRPWIAQHYR